MEYSSKAYESSNSIELAAKAAAENSLILRPVGSVANLFGKYDVVLVQKEISANKAKFALSEITDKELSVVIASLAGANLQAFMMYAAQSGFEQHDKFLEELAALIEEKAAITFGRNANAHPETFMECAKIVMDTETYRTFSHFDLVLAFRHIAKQQLELYSSFSTSVFIKAMNAWNDVRKSVKKAIAMFGEEQAKAERHEQHRIKWEQFRDEVLQAVVFSDTFIRQMIAQPDLLPSLSVVMILKNIKFPNAFVAIQPRAIQDQACEMVIRLYPHKAQDFVAAYKAMWTRKDTSGKLTGLDTDWLESKTRLGKMFSQCACRLFLLAAHQKYQWSSIGNYFTKQNGWIDQPKLR